MKRRLLLTLLVLLSITFIYQVKAQIIINEVMVHNTMHYDDEIYNFSDWIELYNPTSSTVRIKYYFTDDKNNPTKWRMKSTQSMRKNSFLLIYFDNSEDEKLNANFKLEPKGGSIYVFDDKGNLVDEVTYPKMNNGNISYGRTTDGGNMWSKMAYPTPETSNISGEPSDKQAEAPVFSEKGGFINGSKNITLTAATPGAKIYYTLNGDEPFDSKTQITSEKNMLTGTALLYTGPITINNSTVIRAKVYADGYLPSTVVTQSYLEKTRDIDLPVFSVTINEKYRNDSKIGIWKNYRDKDMKRPVNVEFFPTQDSEADFNYQMNIEIFGASQRSKEHKQFNIIADKRYNGNNRMKYDFFTEKQGQKRKSITMRTSGQDGKYTMLQDALVHTIIKDQMDIDRGAYQPAVVYINGKYNGLMNIRERHQKDYLESNYGYEPEEYDLLGKHNDHSSIRAARGNKDKWDEMISYLKKNKNNINDAAVYNKVINEYVDEAEVLNYFLVQSYINNRDQPHNNIKAWRPYKAKGNMQTKWRYILHDADLAVIRQSTSGERIKGSMSSSTSNMGYVFYILAKNTSFQQKFASRYLTHAYQTFAPFRVEAIVDRLAANIEKEIPYTNQVHSSVPNLTKWKVYIKEIREYWGERQPYAVKHVQSAFSFKGKEMTLKLNFDEKEGTVYLNTVTLIRNFDGKYIQDLTYDLKAEPKEGYAFAYWDIRTNGTSVQVNENEYQGRTAANATEVIITPVYINQMGIPTKAILEDEPFDETEIIKEDAVIEEDEEIIENTEQSGLIPESVKIIY